MSVESIDLDPFHARHKINPITKKKPNNASYLLERLAMQLSLETSMEAQKNNIHYKQCYSSPSKFNLTQLWKAKPFDPSFVA